MRTQFTIKSKFLHLILVVIFLLYSKNSLAQLTQFHQSFDDLNTPSLPEGWLSKIQVSISNTIAEVKTVHHANATSQPNAVFIMNGLDGTNGQPDANAFVSLASPLIEVGEFGAKVTFTASGGQPIVLGKLTNISDLETFTELQTYILNSEFQEFSYEFASQENIYLVFKNSNQISVNPIFVDEVIFEQLEGPQAPLTEFHENFDEISLPLLPEGWRSKINVLLSNTVAEVKTVHHANTTSQPNAVFVMNGLDGSNGQPDTNAFVSVVSPLIQVLENGAKVTFTASGGNPIILGILTDFEDVETFTALETFDLNSNFQEFSYEIMEPQIGYLVFKNGNTTAVNPIFIDDVIFKQLEEIMSIDDFDRNSVLIYPNPSKDKISVSSDSFITKIELFDLSGKKIIEKKNNSNETSLNISQLTKGTYFIQITQGNIKQSKTIIKK